MTIDVGSARPSRAAGKCLPLLFALLLPLAGCMSSGASSFNEPGRIASNPRAQDEMQELQLDVVNGGASQAQNPDGDTQALALAPATDEIAPGENAEVTGSVTNEALLQEAALQDDNSESVELESEKARQLREETEARLAALAEIADGQDDAGAAKDRARAEFAAEARIPALFASIDHGQCEGGWGPKPKMINAQRIEPEHKFYMEMRMRHTPLLPVGHVYIAYGRLGPDGKPLDERLTMLSPLGGYVGAGIASAVPMPGILKPIGSDCTVRPEAAYRVSLSAQQFEKLLLTIQEQHEKKPSYHLFAYNCNHYLSEVAASVGILPPENIYQPSLTYLYAMMDRNEGREVPRTPSFGNGANQYARMQ